MSRFDVCDPTVCVFRSGCSFSESRHITLGHIYTVREEREGGKERERLKEGRKKRRDAVCLRDCPNKKIFPEFCICHLLLEGISEHVWDGLCAVCLALCAGMQGRPQVNTGAFVPMLFNGLYAQAFSHWVL